MASTGKVRPAIPVPMATPPRSSHSARLGRPAERRNTGLWGRLWGAAEVEPPPIPVLQPGVVLAWDTPQRRERYILHAPTRTARTAAE